MGKRIMLVVAAVVSTILVAIFNVSIDWSTSTSATQQKDTCVEWNYTENWLHSHRVGNSDIKMTDDFVKDMILEYTLLPSQKPQAVLQHSLCHETSQFMNWSDYNATDTVTVQRWALRLLYLIIHDHQHAPAVPEARARFSLCHFHQNHSTIGKYDFECPHTKFLVVPLSPIGLGANLRHVILAAFTLGILNDRVVLFQNGVKGYHHKPRNAKSPNIRDSWLLASCSRGDYQCFILPPTPCVLTEQDLNDAHIISNATEYKAFMNQSLPLHLEKERVLVMEWGPFVFGYEPPSRQPVFDKLAIKAKDLVKRLRGDTRALQMMDIASQIIKDNHRNDVLGPIYSQKLYQESPFAHAVTFYTLRPNLMYQKKLKEKMTVLVRDFDYQHSMGLPIRGTDKCKVESECFSSLQTYMDLAHVWWQEGRWNQSSSKQAVTIVLTSESKEIVDGVQSLNTSFPVKFLVNKDDAVQGTGWVYQYLAQNQHPPADQVMFSSIVALKMQLLPKHSVGNCCSNFHQVLFDYRREECGAVSDGSTSECLFDLPQSKFRLCCVWSKSDECLEKKQNGTWNVNT